MRNGHATNPPAGETFPVTIFPNVLALSKSEQKFALEQLRDFVLSKEKRSKQRLPLIKLASFGDRPNENNCLRYDENVNVVYGIEVDYDREVIAFDSFVAKLRKAKIRALAYTSPSCTLTHPRVRVILPFKKPLLRAQLKRRAVFVSRIDGLFGGNVFGGESWALSQTYYVGRDLSNIDADFRAIVTEGDYIDERGDLHRFEAISVTAREKVNQAFAKKLRAKTGKARQKKNNSKRNQFQRFGDEALFDEVNEALSLMDYKERHGGKGVHHTQRDITYQLVARGWPDEKVIELVLEATLALPEAVKWNRKKEHKTIAKLCTGAHRRLAQEQQELLVIPPEPKPVLGGALSFGEYCTRQRTRITKILGLE